MLPVFKLGNNRKVLPLLAIVIVVGLLWAIRHIYLFYSNQGYNLMPVFTFMFAGIVWQLWLSWKEKPFVIHSDREQQRLDDLYVTVNVPTYQEDPAITHRTLVALYKQTRLPDRIDVVDDGSKIDYSKLREFWTEKFSHTDIMFNWVRKDNGGKRSAQMQTFMNDDKADIFVTIDSDTALDYQAIDEGLKPFIDSKVQSVAGLELGLNRNANLSTRVLDLVITSWQLSTRSALSQVGDVLTNSGPLAFYRADIIRDNAKGYMNEYILGRKVEFSDDSLLTLYAAVKGRAVQQVSAVGWVTRPENFNHIVRQQVRWCRGMFIRSLWRYKYLPIKSYGFWYELIINWVQFIVSMVVLGYLLIYMPIVDGRIIWAALLVAPLLTYVITLRTLIIERSDETKWQTLSNWLISPLIILWGWFVFRPIRIYGAITFWKMKWGTRETVEVYAKETA